MREPSAPCPHVVTVGAGPTVRVCTACGAALERLPEPSGCESAQCEQQS
jgi:hypothetical protein